VGKGVGEMLGRMGEERAKEESIAQRSRRSQRGDWG
jgi:hypothetical protein